MVALLEQVRAVIAIDDEAVILRDDIEKQIEIHKTLGIGVGRDGEILEGKILPDPLQIELRFDQGEPVDLPRHVERPDEGPESVALMIGRIEKKLLGLARGLEEGDAVWELASQRQEVDAMADERPFVVHALPGGRNAGDDIGLSAQAGKQQLIGGQQHGEQGTAVARGRLLHAFAQGSLDRSA